LKDSDGQIVETISFDNMALTKHLFGTHGDNLKIVQNSIGIKISTKGNTITLRGDIFEVELAKRVFSQLYELLKKNYPLYPSDIDYAIRILAENHSLSLEDVFLDTVFISYKKRVIAPKSLSQKEYIDAIRNYDFVVAIGPAGTGKTYLAMAMAVSSLMKKEVERIVLTRPAVEAGEKLGFLPGNMYEKINPYLRPLYDALHDMLDYERISRFIERGIIEIAPLAFMRGRTLNDSFVILDEAQNTSHEQMKMFLTRLGYNSKAVITGDITQIDLPHDKASGLVEIQSVLKNIKGIRFVYFNERDVIRHPLVQEIIKAYELAEKKRKKASSKIEKRKPDVNG